MNDVIKTILSRKGTRVYKKTPIPKETLELLARAAVAAPNAYNAQKWHFSIISNTELLSELEYKVFLKLVEIGICEEGEKYKPFHEAPVVMVFSAAMDNEFGKQDCSTANQNVAIAAKSLNLGSRFLDVPNPFFNSPEGKEYRKRIGLPEDYETICFLSIGYPEDPDELPTEKSMDVVTYIE